MLRASQDYPGVLSSMLFTVSRALRVCNELPDSDYLFQKLTDILRTSVDHLAAYEDFTGLTLVGTELEVVDFEEWIHGPRTNETVELTMLDLGYRLRMADPASRFRADGGEPVSPTMPVVAPPNLMMMLAEHQRSIVQRQQQGAVAAAGSTPYSPTAARSFIDLTGGGAAGYTPTSPVYVPTQAVGAAAVPVSMSIPVPVPTPILGAPIQVVGGPTITTGDPSVRVDSVEGLFIPDV